MIRSRFFFWTRARRRAIALGATAAALDAVVPTHLGAQAGTSSSQAYVYDYLTTSYRCNVSQGPSAGATAAACPVTDFGSTVAGSAGSADSHVLSASASSSLTQSGPPGSAQEYGFGSGYVLSRLFLTGVPASDQLIFHFATNQSALAGGGGLGGESDWLLGLGSAANNAQVAQAYDVHYTDGTSTGVQLYSAQQTATGFDLFLSVPSESVLDYFFRSATEAYAYYNPPAGSTMTASLDARLQGIDAVNSGGGIDASAMFDDQTGFATLDVTATPEPASVALLATGLVGIAGAVARRRRSTTE